MERQIIITVTEKGEIESIHVSPNVDTLSVLTKARTLVLNHLEGEAMLEASEGVIDT